jgi:ABC-type transport system involved in multi-copper enzyme maturation permease subunit
MRPYLAIIYDSFIDAARSRVLWVLLAAWTIILAAIAPFGIIEGTTFDIQPDQILARQQLLDELTNASQGNGTAAQRAVWESIEPNFQQQIIDRQKNKRGGRLPMGQIASGLSSVLKNPNLYAQEAWPTAAKRKEFEGVLDKPDASLSDQQRQRINRRLVELAFPGNIRSGEGNAIWIGYAGIKVSEALPVSRKQIQPFFEGRILMWIFKIGLGIVGVFVGVIVTSPMIPELFQVGSMHLLLSKPISRTWLLVAKFIGGTVFVALNVSYLLIGFYGLVGLRLEIWNHGILWCIPIFVFVFMIYYSVSVVAGLIWKNAIISIAIVALFWAFTTVIGITHGVMQAIVAVFPEITRIEKFGDTLVSVTNRGTLQMWDASKQQWVVAFGEIQAEESILGPFWIASEKSLYLGRPIRIPFGGLQSDGIRLQIAKLPELDDASPSKLDETPIWSDKRIDSGPEFPPRTRRAIAWEGSIVALTERGLYALDLDAVKATDTNKPFSILDLPILGGKPAEAYRRMTPDDWLPESPMDICYVASERYFIVFTHGKLVKLEPTEDRNQFRVGSSIDLELPDGSLALVACNGKTCLIATNKQGVWRVNCATWGPATRLDSIEDCVPRSLVASPNDGSFALLGRDGELWSIFEEGTSAKKVDIPIQGKCSAVMIDPSGKWWLAHDVNHVSCWDSRQSSLDEEIVPTRSVVERVYYWLIQPLYKLNPKPAAVDSAIQRSLTREDPMSLGRETTELQIKRGVDEDPWQPIWSNAIFIVCMLGIGSWYLHRQDL